MPKERLDGEQIRVIFIKMDAKRMLEEMAGKVVFQPKPRFLCKDELVHGIRDRMPLRKAGHWKKLSGGFS